MVELEDVVTTRVRGCTPPDNGAFLHATGADTRIVSIAGNFGSVADSVDATEAENASVEER